MHVISFIHQRECKCKFLFFARNRVLVRESYRNMFLKQTFPMTVEKVRNNVCEMFEKVSLIRALFYFVKQNRFPKLVIGNKFPKLV